jgi:hypothetical protein
MRRYLLLNLGLLCLIGLLGCSLTNSNRHLESTTVFKPHNYHSDPALSPNLHRVVLLPVHAGVVIDQQTAETLDPVIVESLVRQLRFEVVTLSREQCEKTFGTLDLSSSEALPDNFLQTLAQRFGVEAVMFVDVTSYSPYPPISVGLRGKLVSCSDSHYIWNFDEVFSTGNPEVITGLRVFFVTSGHSPYPVDLSLNALQSHSRLAYYASYTIFSTLPFRYQVSLSENKK